MMKKFLSVVILTSLPLISLQGQVQWKFSSQKITDDLFEIHLAANIEKGWHLYAQSQPPDAIVTPASIKFDNSSTIQLQGEVKEIGNREVYENKEIGVKCYQYKSHVDFIQLIRLIKNKKTIINGSISVVMCNDQQCLPPKTEKFTLQIL